jgi:SAM-dependent methyltransferase
MSRYTGGELDLFAAATNWKRYVARLLAPHIGRRVLEVGAGIGTNTAFLAGPRVDEWLCLEPDPSLAGRIGQLVAAGALSPCCRVVGGTIAALGVGAAFDTILYLDVLEHIAADRSELADAARLLAAGGALAVLAPAHPFLFTPFDTAVGHYRRYTRASLRALAPPGCRLEALLMLDSAGFFASLANRLLLSAALPTPRQIAVWDKFLVPLSQAADRATRYRFGKSVLAIWRRTG